MGSRDRELKRAVRNLLRNMGFTAICVSTLAIAIGANTAVFSIVNAVLLRPLPFPGAQELYGLWHTAPGLGIPKGIEQSNATYLMYRDHNRSFIDIGISGDLTMNLTGGGEPVRVSAATATASLFRALRVAPQLGRLFDEEDDRLGGPQTVILSYKLWRGRFGGDPHIPGTTITLNQTPWEVVGVMPDGFTYPGEETGLWIPHRIDPSRVGELSFNYEAVGRLRPGVTPEAAGAELTELLYRLPEAYPGQVTRGLLENAQMKAYLNPLLEDVVGDTGQVLWILLGTVGFVLLVACANVANLFLVRAEGRGREIALRTALGAGRADMIRHFLTESLLLSVLGGLFGLGLAYLCIQVLILLAPENIPRLDEITIDGVVLTYTVLLSIFSGLFFGLFPFLRYRRQNVVEAINEGGSRSSVGRETHRTRNVLVAAQVALALILLIGSGLMARSFRELRDVDPGFQTANILTLRVSLPEAEYREAQDAAGFYQELVDDLLNLPGVVEAGATTNLPLTDGDSNDGTLFEDFPLRKDEIPPVLRTNRVTTGYFEAMGIPLMEGRTFERRDHEEKTGAVIISARLAHRFWPGRSALGKRLAATNFSEPKWYHIVGVVGDVRDDGLDQPAPEMVYFPTVGLEEGDDAWVVRTMSIALRTSGSPLALAPAARDTVWALNPHLPVANIRTGEEIASTSMARTAYTMLLLGVAAAVALLLGAVGLYGVISYVVSQRTREIGIRMALGAQRSDVGRMVVGHGALITLAGIGTGLLGALALTRLMSALLFGVSPTDPFTFTLVPMVLLGVTALASYIPARRAAAVDPAEALRHE